MVVEEEEEAVVAVVVVAVVVVVVVVEAVVAVVAAAVVALEEEAEAAEAAEEPAVVDCKQPDSSTCPLNSVSVLTFDAPAAAILPVAPTLAVHREEDPDLHVDTAEVLTMEEVRPRLLDLVFLWPLVLVPSLWELELSPSGPAYGTTEPISTRTTGDIPTTTLPPTKPRVIPSCVVVPSMPRVAVEKTILP